VGKVHFVKRRCLRENLKMPSLRILLLMVGIVVSVHGQDPSAVPDAARSHPRIEKTETAGKRAALQSLKGATLFTSNKFTGRPLVPLIIHFHGAPWLIERHVAMERPDAALITVQLGAGSSAYGRPFADPGLFPRLVAEARDELGLTKGWSSITLSGFSAGYGAVRAILRQPENYKRVSSVLLLDGIHASYEPEGRGLADGGSISTLDLDSFVAFARDAAAGKKTFVLTHSEIFPGTYASTTECIDHLLSQIKIKRKSKLKNVPMGMQQLSSVSKRSLYVFGYAGDSAPDHADHLHAMPFWFRYLGIK